MSDGVRTPPTPERDRRWTRSLARAGATRAGEAAWTAAVSGLTRPTRLPPLVAFQLAGRPLDGFLRSGAARRDLAHHDRQQPLRVDLGGDLLLRRPPGDDQPLLVADGGGV